MRPVLTIFWKELKAHLTSPGYYLITAIYVGLMSWLYSLALRNFTQMSVQQMAMMRGQGGQLNLHQYVIQPHIQYVNLAFLFFIPILTTKYFAEEKRARTFDLLLTSPINATQIVAGKMLAAIAATWILATVSILYPVITSRFADFQWGLFFSSYVAVYLVSAVYASIGVFCSSLTESAIVAGIMGFILCLSSWFISWGSMVSENQALQKILNQVSLANHFSQLIQGSVEVVAISFFVSIIFFFGFLTQRVVESTRWR
jgi:ABC-2 type transport system permease protein